MALYTVPKLPVPNFSNSVYWLAGLLVGIGNGSGADGRGTRSSSSFTGDEDGDFVSALGCKAEPEPESVLERLPLRSTRGFEAMAFALSRAVSGRESTAHLRRRQTMDGASESHERASGTARG